MEKYYFINTYGCQMNVHESEKIAGILSERGYKETKDDSKASVIVFNTCCIRENAEDKIYGNIGILKKRKKTDKDLIIAVGGCMTQQNNMAEKLKKTFPFVDIIFGTHNLEEFGKLFDKKLTQKKSVIEVLEKEKEIIEGTPKKRTSFPNAWVNIMYGCNNFCTYCIVPFVRGRERSRKLDEIVRECESLIKDGYKEITLLGQNVNSYGKDLSNGTSFATLLNAVSKIDGKFRIRFMTNHPKDFTDEMIHAINSDDKICKCVHLPVQAGSDRILKLMNRHYDRAYYEDRLNTLRKIIPNSAVTTDIMVGFPTETEEDFLDTLNLVKNSNFGGAFTFVYSRRTGTVADKMEGQIPEDVATKRIMELIAVQNEINRNQSLNYIGKTVEILCEDYDDKKQLYLGRDEFNKMVYFFSETNVIGEFLDVKIVKAGGMSLYGELIKG
ncbi:MAG: tRNA (N6-isopentenyl adenosine(37)-C2)-methylthiotransferase MiaB [Clostridia bacterium]|nr:tRNA (N6-isopentenyl adenosine(37)-C2)-methylthiotransferase MiaB [Clostridia bacterium]